MGRLYIATTHVKLHGKGGQCKHIVALLFQVIEYIKQLNMTEINPRSPYLHTVITAMLCTEKE
jgi:hypothetical protein